MGTGQDGGRAAHQREVLGGEAADARGVLRGGGHRQEVDDSAVHGNSAAEGAGQGAVEVERDVT